MKHFVILAAFMIPLNVLAAFKPVDKNVQEQFLKDVGTALYQHINELKSIHCIMPNEMAVGILYERNNLKYSTDIFLSEPQGSSLEISVFKDEATEVVLIENEILFRKNQLEVHFNNGKIKGILAILDIGTDHPTRIQCGELVQSSH